MGNVTALFRCSFLRKWGFLFRDEGGKTKLLSCFRTNSFFANGSENMLNLMFYTFTITNTLIKNRLPILIS